ncbi:MAG: cysteine desulfurase family protein [Nitrospirota bacterium]
MKVIYFDYNATTPVDRRVLEAMIPYLGVPRKTEGFADSPLESNFGNPSSSHVFGKDAKDAIESARAMVANLLGCSVNEIVFTSGGSESNNLAVKGIAYANREKGNHIITSMIEHPSILNPCRYLEKQGFEVSYLRVGREGIVDPDDVKKAINNRTILITIMHANNETGVIQPIKEISSVAKNAGVYLHTDAAQSVGKIQTKVNELGVDLLTIAGHKFYAPKGVGSLFIREGVKIEPIIHGAGHERRLRSGTENVAGIVGLGKAVEIAIRDMKATASYLVNIRNRMFSKLSNGVEIRLNGYPEMRLPNTLNVYLKGVDTTDLLSSLQYIAASTASACHSGTKTPSHVLLAMGLTEGEALSSIRFSFGKWTTEDEIDTAAEMIIKYIKNKS